MQGQARRAGAVPGHWWVALADLKLAKILGARVAITSSSDEKLKIARELGADITVNYRELSDWIAQLMSLTDNAGADVVIETGGQDTLGQSIAAAGVNGRVVVIGVTPGQKSPIPDYVSFLVKNVTNCIFRPSLNTAKLKYCSWIFASPASLPMTSSPARIRPQWRGL